MVALQSSRLLPIRAEFRLKRELFSLHLIAPELFDQNFFDLGAVATNAEEIPDQSLDENSVDRV